MDKIDIKISGSGAVPSGEYGKMRFSGSVRLGDVKCISYSSCGSAKGEGVFCEEGFKASGSVKLTGNVKAQDLKASGSFACKELKASTININGCVKIEGVSKADDTRIYFSKCQIGSIYGGNVKVEKDKFKKILGKLLFFCKFGNATIAQSIDGDTVSVEYITAPLVKGKKVYIQSGCIIDKVIYEDEVAISTRARVGMIQKLER